MFEKRFRKINLKKPVLFHNLADQNTKFMESFEMIRHKVWKARWLEGKTIYIKFEKA